ncbi:polyprenyl synthetase family protein [Aquincola sp. J276]|uniref:polyprenyl synthetase family protein n=1 Tax=Aquincola sp. J276 TaxID=2898432 RepID=UPI00215185AC|nr:polyprenyl synthetase family protein [Aquincola sp. J276]MCR5868034.1 polyprenyl synthetase family protein [Aquincola sp. J276]
MSTSERIEQLLVGALAAIESPAQPPRLAAAVRHAVFPGGARVRPRLVLAVHAACGEGEASLAGAAAAAVELLHCASLVHDDLPCFDDAPLRRGLPSVHRAFGERLAVLAGDALIVLAFQVLAQASCRDAGRLAQVLATVAGGVGLPGGICAGQAWECEPQVCLADYQRAKTGALFAAAAAAGAQAAGAAPAPWRAFGDALGEAYQVADDIRDVAADPGLLGKPIGRDLALGRPSVARRDGVAGAIRRFNRLVAQAVAAVPDCPGAEPLRMLVRLESERLVPKALSTEWLASAA